jgi:predicted RNase H-related nuclease YkuK (DUF458 family)
MKDFKLLNGKEIDNLGDYIRNYYNQNPKIKIYVGTDSIQNGKFTKYVTTVAMLHPEHIDENGKFHFGSGVHLVYRRQNIKKIKDVYTRLFHETELSIELANYVHDSLKNIWKSPTNNKKIPIVHLDFNAEPNFKSYQVYDVSMGYISGLGFEVFSKPSAWCASVASDWLCK